MTLIDRVLSLAKVPALPATLTSIDLSYNRLTALPAELCTLALSLRGRANTALSLSSEPQWTPRAAHHL